MVSPSGSMHSLRTTVPGCGGFFIGITVSLVIIQIVDLKRLAIRESKDDAPIGSDNDRPQALQLPLKPMKPETGKVHIVHGYSCVHPRENIAQLRQVLRVYSPRVVVFIEAFQPLVAKGLNHGRV
jgi:hypothetical protein